MIGPLLFVLATLDAAFVGWRSAAGRTGIVRKVPYYMRAMLRGAMAGQVGIFAIALTVALCFWFAPGFNALWQDFEKFGEVLLWFFIPYATIAVLAFVPRFTPSVDIRSMTNVVIFGPFTLIRPYLVVAGVLTGLLLVPRWETLALGAVIVASTLLLEPVLDWMYRRGVIQPLPGVPGGR